MFIIPAIDSRCVITTKDEINYFFKEAAGKCIEIICDFITDPFYRILSSNFVSLHEQLIAHESHNLPESIFEPRPFRDFYDFQIPDIGKLRKFIRKYQDNQNNNILSTLSLKESEFVTLVQTETKEHILLAGILRHAFLDEPGKPRENEDIESELGQNSLRVHSEGAPIRDHSHASLHAHQSFGFLSHDGAILVL